MAVVRDVTGSERDEGPYSEEDWWMKDIDMATVRSCRTRMRLVIEHAVAWGQVAVVAQSIPLGTTKVSMLHGAAVD